MERLKELRTEAGLSGYALAKRAGLTTTAYYALEAQSTKPTYDTLMSLARVLGEMVGRQPSEVLAELTQVNEKPLSEAAAA